MSSISETSFNNTMKITQGAAKFLLKLLDAIAGVILERDKTAAQRRMARYIKEGGEVHYYTIQGNCSSNLINELEKNRIPYIRILDDNTIIIQENMLERVQDINRQILVNRGNYFQSVPLLEMLDAKKAEDGIATFRGLSEYDVEVFKNKCNNIVAGFTVGVQAMSDGTYNLGAFYDNMFKTDLNPTEADTCKAYLQTMFSLYGENGAQKKIEIDYDKSVDIAVWDAIRQKETCFVVGSGNKYVEINENGLEIYNISYEGGRQTFHQLEKFSITDVNFASELERCLDVIEDKIYCPNIEALNTVLSIAPEKRCESEVLSEHRPARTPRMQQISSAYDRMTDKIDQMIKKRVAPQMDGLGGLSPLQVFNVYKQEAEAIIDALANDKIPKGYRSQQMEELKDCANLDDSNEVLNFDSLRGVSGALAGKTVENTMGIKLDDKTRAAIKQKNTFYNINID